jgi:hypothetical protein
VLQLGIWNILSYCSIFMSIIACLYLYYMCGGIVGMWNGDLWGFVAHFLDTGNPAGVYACIKGARRPIVRSMTTRHAGLEKVHASWHYLLSYTQHSKSETRFVVYAY